jgi:hypothetical protein
VRSVNWDIGLSKTGYIAEAGRCLVMRVRMASREVIVVLLDSWGKFSRVGDANRIKKWLEAHRRRARPPCSGPRFLPRVFSTSPADSFREDVIAGLSLPQKACRPSTSTTRGQPAVRGDLPPEGVLPDAQRARAHARQPRRDRALCRRGACSSNTAAARAASRAC